MTRAEMYQKVREGLEIGERSHKVDCICILCDPVYGALPALDALEAEEREAPKPDVSVAGQMQRSLADHERACLVLLEDEQQKIAPDNALISTLCESVRMMREYCDAVKRGFATPPAQSAVEHVFDGVGMIATERRRQIEKEGWSPEHDDEHALSELSRAAFSYAFLAAKQAINPSVCVNSPVRWPWNFKWWKPSPDPVRNLVKAGALIVAEIDRLQRIKEKS